MIKQFYKIKKNLLLLLIAFATGKNLTAQVSVSGPLCVIPGITYQYVIAGNWNASSAMRVCIAGGALSTGDTCTPAGTVVSSVLVIWNDTGFHQLEVTSSSGDINVIVQRTTELNGGLMHDSGRVQVYDPTIANYIFRCEAAKGGSCNPVYSYQWQKSRDGLTWANIDGATRKDLQYTGSVAITTYFRRITAESESNTIGYSDWGQLDVEFR